MIMGHVVPNIIKICPQHPGESFYIKYPRFHAYQVAGETVKHQVHHTKADGSTNIKEIKA
jgi:hypothetical protein